MKMRYRDAVEREHASYNWSFYKPYDDNVMKHLRRMRNGSERRQQEAVLVVAEAMVCVIDRLDTVIELLEGRDD